MDTIAAPELAKRLGLSLPTVHRILDAEGVPRTGRGMPRYISAQHARRLVRLRPPGLGAEEARVLAALRSSIRGIESARKVAAVAGVSPTTAVKVLRRHLETGLVRREDARVISRGSVTHRQVYRLDTSHPGWPQLRTTVDSVTLVPPMPERSNAVPKRFWHLFWNVDPAVLRVDQHGSFIAKRMLTGADLAAAVWVLENVPGHRVRDAISARGVDARTKAFATNFLQQAEVA